jgi:hypothetical protein
MWLKEVMKVLLAVMVALVVLVMGMFSTGILGALARFLFHIYLPDSTGWLFGCVNLIFWSWFAFFRIYPGTRKFVEGHFEPKPKAQTT